MTITQELEPVKRLSKDLSKASITLSLTEVRFLVDMYYMMQENRKRADSQARSLGENEEPHMVLNFFAYQFDVLESQLKRALDKFTDAHPVGGWLRGITGIGPVISAGLLAHIDIEKAPTVGHIWRYAGLDPTQKWEKGQIRPWNASLKRLCWIIGECFVKVSNNEKDFYGKIWARRKELETKNNEAGLYKEQAEAILKKVPNHKQKAIYAKGILPPGHIHMRAQRYAVKLFLSHLHREMYLQHYKKEPPLPYPIAHLGHAHFIEYNAGDHQ